MKPVSSLVRRTYVYKRAGECAIHLDLYESDAMPGPSPVVVWIHGGALISGSRKGAAERAERYVARGWRVASIDYRLAPETKLPEIIQDVKDAFGWIRRHSEELRIDPHRIAVVGHSAGGYLTLMSGTFDPKPKALVSFYGYGDLVGDWYSKPDPFYRTQPLVSRESALAQLENHAISEDRRPGRFYLYTRQNGLWPVEVGGRDPARDPAFFVPYCPEENIGPDYPPTLLLHGTNDTDVPYALSVRMRDRLNAAGIDNTLITIQGGGHGFDGQWWEPEVQGAFDWVMDFLGRHLGDE